MDQIANFSRRRWNPNGVTLDAMPLPFHWRLTKEKRQSVSSKNPCQYPWAAADNQLGG
jgi:hypothetical protein